MAKKTSKKTATKKPVSIQDAATAAATSLPASDPIPEGFEQVGGGYAATWKTEQMQVIHGQVTGAVREVELTIGRKKQTRRCMEVTTKKSGERFTVWESAALGDLFDKVTALGEGCEVYIRFDGLGKAKTGQNAPKLFTVAIKE